MANSSALPFPIPSGAEDVVPLDEGIRDCGERSTTSHRRRRIGLQRLGAKETKEQGFAGIRAPSPKGWSSEKGQRLGAKETEKQGFAGVFAPSPKGWSSEKGQRLGAKETKEQGFSGIRAPSPKPRSGAPPKPDAGNPPLGTPPTRIPYFLAMKEAAVPSAQRLLPYIMLFLGLQDQRRSPRRPAAPSSGPLTPAKPTPPGSAPQARQRLASPAAPRKSGGAAQARQRPRHTDEVC